MTKFLLNMNLALYAIHEIVMAERGVLDIGWAVSGYLTLLALFINVLRKTKRQS